MTSIITNLQKDILINERIVEIENPSSFSWQNIYSEIRKQVKENSIIKLNLVKTTKDKLFFNVVSLSSCQQNLPTLFPSLEAAGSAGNGTTHSALSCLIIPTGIGAKFGGYAGDANPIAKLLAKKSRFLITNPNTVNGAVLSDLPENIIYLEGFFLDLFLLGKINIIPKRNNKIGVIFDRAINEERLEYELNVLNALKSFYGCEIIGWTRTKKPLNILPSVNNYGFSSGMIENIDCLLESSDKLKTKGSTAIAVCTLIPDLEINPGYISGEGIDSVGGIESIISRLVSAYTGLVSAHAPVLHSAGKVNYRNISPVSAAEFIAPTFLPSVISGLRFAPEIAESKGVNNISFSDICEIVVPYNAFGSPGVIYSNELFNNVVLVKENKTCLEVNPEHIDMKFKTVKSYSDILNPDLIHESGISKECLERPVRKVLEIR